jgi:HlyD family secretion protein
MVLCLVLWAAFGRLDIVVQAHGKLVPATLVKVSQPAEDGRILEVLVRDGQAVGAGELLARLDATQANQDARALQTQHDLLLARSGILQAELAGKARHTGEPSVDAEFALRRAAYRQTLAGAQAQLAAARSELAGEEQALAKETRLLTLAERAEEAHRGLKEQGFVSELAFQTQQKERIEHEQGARAIAQSVRAHSAQVLHAESALTQVTADYRQRLAQEHTQTSYELERVRADLAKARHRESLAEIRAPVAGTVNSLAVRTAGQVVTAGSVLMTIVPEAEALLAEVWVRNEDAGFVYPGMPVKVKLATFPFQKYGWLTGTLQWLGADAEVPEAFRNAQGEPLFFKARVALDAQHLTRNGKRFDAKVGMQVVADLQLGERTLFEYLTSPIQKAVLEAARER